MKRVTIYVILVPALCSDERAIRGGSVHDFTCWL